MSTKTKVKTIKRCIELCRKQLDNVKVEIGVIELEEEETDIEKLDALLKAVGNIERSCQNIREYARECDEY